MKDKTETPAGFSQPVDLPSDSRQGEQWQEKNRSWWQNNPMRYDWNSDIQYEEFSKEFYEEIDRRFFSAAAEFIPYKSLPFDELIDFGGLANKDVLEIGVGNGSHAQLIARHSKTYTGIDITDYSVESTTNRLKNSGVDGEVIRMDAENMGFPDQSFDYIWTWGVIHHSSNTEKILQEMHRVLRPNGEAVVMVYHRNIWNYYIVNGLVRGILLGELLRTGSLHAIVQKHTDGAIARYYTAREWKALSSKYFDVLKITIYGQKAGLFPMPSGAIKNFLMKMLPNSVSRVFTNRLRFGDLLVSVLRK